MSIPFIPLPKDRYNFFQRNLAAEQISRDFKMMTMATNTCDIDYDFYVDSFVFEKIKQMDSIPEKSLLLDSFRIFCTNSKYHKYFCGFLEITVKSLTPLVAPKKVIVSEVVIASILYHNLVVDFDKMPLVLSDIRNNVKRDVDLIPCRESGTDGQMKILVDAVLAVDSMESKDSKKVCVIGSSHEATIHPRYAYAPVMQMLTSSEVHMYDYVEEKGVTKEGTNFVTRNSTGVDYKTLKDYDLVIDDVWANGKTSLMSDYMRDKTIDEVYPDNFSIKSFGERTDEAIVYKQCGFTNAGEQRVVSRPVVPYYKSRRYLGSCIYCRELKFFLRGDYDISFYKAILLSHKRPCYVPELNKLVDFVSSKHDLMTNLDWREILVRTFHTQQEIDFKMRLAKKQNKTIEILDVDIDKLRQHPSDVLDFDVIELRAEILSLVDVIVSLDLYVTRLIYESAKNIYKVEGRDFFILSRPVRGVTLTSSLDDFSQSLSHRGYWT